MDLRRLAEDGVSLRGDTEVGGDSQRRVDGSVASRTNHAMLAAVGMIRVYSCAACGYRAEVNEGGGFYAMNELRQCRATNDLVAVTVRVHARGDRNPPHAIPIGVCSDCGSPDVAEPTCAGGKVACPRCGEATKRSSTGLWD